MQNLYKYLIAATILQFTAFKTIAQERFELNSDLIWSEILNDYETFYQRDRLLRVAGVFSLGAVVANSRLDPKIQTWHQDNIKSSFSDNISSVAKLFGEKTLMVPISLAATAMQLSSTKNAFGHWGQLTFRSYLVGAPAVGTLQLLTGGSRPRDHYQDAHWRPFNDDNGVSGHAFMGAVPFLVLSKMDHLSPMQQNLALFASGLSAWSRVNDDAHYFSQALLGWFMAWEAVDAVNSNGLNGNWMQVSPYTFGDGIGVSVAVNW
ncbi:phosphatase PAP2 family protein [Psychrosphaera aquimarina]|mgnify:FL=1|uniref:Phosphatase PAP2 family protein n=2 Tax=Bacteria TaxID=2 RepID=A0ABU3R056_9GAMM|nr:phosphatase PAP2 family protein [Psychrosphaera aquimarina]MDU0112919.1 phosphatase PAP2 family protein [Psychrosphaera aquimarina]